MEYLANLNTTGIEVKLNKIDTNHATKQRRVSRYNNGSASSVNKTRVEEMTNKQWHQHP